MKKEKHRAIEIDLNCEPFPDTISDYLKEYLQDLSKTAHNCKNCGSIQPELHLVDNDRTYSFVCYKIMDSNGKVTAKTDYKQFGAYCIICDPDKTGKALSKKIYEKYVKSSLLPRPPLGGLGLKKLSDLEEFI